MSSDRQREPLPESTFFSLVSVICALMFALYFAYNYTGAGGTLATGPNQTHSSAATSDTVTR